MIVRHQDKACIAFSDATCVRSCSFEERLKAQRAEKEAAEKEARRLGFKKQLSKEEKTTKRSQRLAAIGEDLLALSADQPFRFPATFTFVVRAFSSERTTNSCFQWCEILADRLVPNPSDQQYRIQVESMLGAPV